MALYKDDKYRTCQECGLKVKVRKLFRDMLDQSEAAWTRYTSKQCPRCKSEALDYGTTFTPDTEENEDA